MADFSISSAIPATGYADVGTYIADSGGITIGDIVYDKGSQVAAKGDANNTSATAAVIGMAMNTAAAGGKVCVGKGNITVNSVGTPADPIVQLSVTAGKLQPPLDITVSQRLVICGYWVSATEIKIAPINTGITTPAS